jgi:mannosyltransferase
MVQTSRAATASIPCSDFWFGAETDEPAGILHRVDGNNYDPDNPNSDRINATLLSLVRNSELPQLIQSMKDLERTWNHKFNYPWTFINDVPFTEEFKRETRKHSKAEIKYEIIPKEHWDIPSWINKDMMKESAKLLEEQNVQYAGLESYHQMCRWNSGLFYKHPALLDMQYYWRVEPNVHFFCDVDYDVFRYMRDNNKTYGFTVNLYDSPESISGLWPETIKFLAENKHKQAQPNAMKWLTDKDRRPDHNRKANGYSTCHFWSNFEIADMSFWRSPEYEAYFEHLDRAGGFFYERWGDAPVHSIGLIVLHHAEAKLTFFIGSRISATSTFLSSTALIRPSVEAAPRAASLTAKPGLIERTAGRIGLNTWAMNGRRRSTTLPLRQGWMNYGPSLNDLVQASLA